MNIRSKFFLLLMIAFSFTIIGCSHSQVENGKEAKTTKTANANPIDFEKAFFVDVRTPGEFASGHFEGAINIPLNELESRASEFEGKEQVVVYCRSGARSGSAKLMLENKGIKNVINGINTENLERAQKQE